MMHALKRAFFYLSWPGLKAYFWVGTRARILVTDHSGRVLLVQGKWSQWYGDNSWMLPGGGVRWGEQPAQAAARELAEEIGIIVAADDLELLGREYVREQRIGYSAYLYRLAVNPAVPLKLQRSEIARAEWFDAQTIETLRLKPDAQAALRLLAAAR
jgi:8-oxo-dGTP diphosphatase